MFDVHILSINVGIHYISVLIKYFFFPVENGLDCMYMKEDESVCETQSVLLQRHNIHVTGNTYVMADL